MFLFNDIAEVIIRSLFLKYEGNFLKYIKKKMKILFSFVSGVSLAFLIADYFGWHKTI